MSDNETRRKRLPPPSSPAGWKAAPVGSSCNSCRFLCVIFWAAIALLVINVYLLLSLGLGWEAKKHALSTSQQDRKLAVIVPTHAGDLAETIESLKKWPTACSPDTLHHVDLVIYKAEGFDETTEKEVSL